MRCNIFCIHFSYEISLWNRMLSAALFSCRISLWDFMFCRYLIILWDFMLFGWCKISVWDFILCEPKRFHEIPWWDFLMRFTLCRRSLYEMSCFRCIMSSWDFLMMRVHSFCYMICIWEVMLLSRCEDVMLFSPNEISLWDVMLFAA